MTVWALLVWTACQDPCDALAVEVGTGVDRFEPLEPGTDVEIVHGSQGGWHVLGAVRTWGLADVVRLTYTIERASDGALLSDNLFTVVSQPTPGACSREFSGLFGVLSIAAIPHEDTDTPASLLDGERLRLVIAAEDDATQASDDVTVVARDLEAVDP